MLSLQEQFDFDLFAVWSSVEVLSKLKFASLGHIAIIQLSTCQPLIF